METTTSCGTRILFVEMAVGWGGSGKSLLELLDHLPNVEPVVLSAFRLKGSAPRGPRVTFVEMPPVKRASKEVRFLRYLEEVRYQWAWFTTVWRTSRQYRVKCIYANNGISYNLPCLLVARLLRVPLVFHQRSWEDETIIGGIARKLAHDTPIIAVSDAVGSHLVGKGISNSNVHRIYDLVEHDEQKSRVTATRQEALTVVVHGMLTPWKGHQTVLEAITLLEQEHSGRFQVLIAGAAVPGEEAYEVKLKRDVDERGLSGVVRFVGFVEDVFALLSQCHIAVHASVKPEPLGRVVAEAQLAGVCVVASELGGVQELVSEGRGLTFKPGDARGLANCLLRLLEHPALRFELAKNARESAVAMFDHEKISAAVARVIKSALVSGTPVPGFDDHSGGST